VIHKNVNPELTEDPAEEKANINDPEVKDPQNNAAPVEDR
jgi:hypothetical protein